MGRETNSGKTRYQTIDGWYVLILLAVAAAVIAFFAAYVG